MGSDPLTQELLTVAASLQERGRLQGQKEANKDYFGQSAVRLTAGIFATALGAAAQQMGSYSPLAARFFAAKAQEFQAFATPPSVVSTSPQQDTQNVSVADQVVIQFAVPMDVSTLNPDNVYIGPASGGQHLSADLDYDPSNNTLTLIPSNPLSAGVTYKVTVSQAVESESGQPLQTDYTMTFGTAS